MAHEVSHVDQRQRQRFGVAPDGGQQPAAQKSGEIEVWWSAPRVASVVRLEGGGAGAGKLVGGDGESGVSDESNVCESRIALM